MKKLLIISALAMLLGAGCAVDRKLPPAFLKDAQTFTLDSSTTISGDLLPNLPVPPPAGPVATSGQSNFIANNSNEPNSRSQNNAPKRVNVNLPKPSAIGAAANYGKNLNQFRGRGAYFQLVRCQANPGYMVIKKGTAFMLDNRDAAAHTVKINNQEFRLPPYGYAITSAEVASSTRAQYLICDGATVAGILVQP